MQTICIYLFVDIESPCSCRLAIVLAVRSVLRVVSLRVFMGEQILGRNGCMRRNYRSSVTIWVMKDL
jgi:hypothetical protein